MYVTIRYFLDMAPIEPNFAKINQDWQTRKKLDALDRRCEDSAHRCEKFLHRCENLRTGSHRCEKSRTGLAPVRRILAPV